MGSIMNVVGWALAIVVLFASSGAEAQDPLPSWRDGKSRRAIISFVEAVTRTGSPNFVAPADRIAVFDNDGTLWSEQPYYNQLAFALDRVKALSSAHPDWKTLEPFASVLRNDLKTLLSGDESEITRKLLEIVKVTHADITEVEFARIVAEWIKEARHPGTGRRYTAMVYQPMLELLAYLRANNFSTFIVSGGGADFMRVWTEQIYGVPPQQVIGSRIKLRFEMLEGAPSIVRLPEVEFMDDKAGKPVGIMQHVGRRPLAAFGNSDGDLEMLQWTCLRRDEPTLCMFVHHTDEQREWAYDRGSQIGKLDLGMDAAKAHGWPLIDMKVEWKQIFVPSTD